MLSNDLKTPFKTIVLLRFNHLFSKSMQEKEMEGEEEEGKRREEEGKGMYEKRKKVLFRQPEIIFNITIIL